MARSVERSRTPDSRRGRRPTTTASSWSCGPRRRPPASTRPSRSAATGAPAMSGDQAAALFFGPAVAQRTGSVRGLRKMTPVGGVAPGRAAAPASRRARPRVRRASRAARGGVPTQACGPWAKARCDRAFGPPEVETVRVREGRRVAIRGGQRHDDEVAPADQAPPSSRPRWRSGRPGRPRARDAATPRRRSGRASDRRGRGRAVRGGQQVPEQATSSCPRSSRCRRTSSRRRWRRPRRRPGDAVASASTPPRPRRPVDVPREGRDAPARRRTDHTARRHPIDRRDDSSYQPRTTPGPMSSELEGAGHDLHGQRSGEVASDVGAARPAASPSTRRRAGLDRAAKRPRASGRRKRRRTGHGGVDALAIERQHARPDDLCGREPGVVDGERSASRMTSMQRSRGSRASRPGQGPRTPARAREGGRAAVGIAVELREGQGRPEREVAGRVGSGQSASVRAGSRGQYRRGGGTRSSATRGRGRRPGPAWRRCHNAPMSLPTSKVAVAAADLPRPGRRPDRARAHRPARPRAIPTARRSPSSRARSPRPTAWTGRTCCSCRAARVRGDAAHEPADRLAEARARRLPGAAARPARHRPIDAGRRGHPGRRRRPSRPRT